MKYLAAISGMLGLGLLYLLSSASANSELFSHNYSTLLILTIGLASSLGVLVIYQTWQLIAKLRSGVFGAKLTLRLALFFCAIAILPGLLVYAVSVQFLSKSIESWFDIRVEKALEGGINLGRNSLENELKQLGKKAQLLAMILADQPPEKYRNVLARFTDKSEKQESALFDLTGHSLAVFNDQSLAIWKSLDVDSLEWARKHGSYQLIDALPDDQLILRVLVRVVSNSDSRNVLILHIAQPVPPQFAADAETVQAVYRDYQQLSSSRLGLKRLYGITLTLSLLIVLLSAVSAAFFLSARLSAPLAALSEGTKAVARGDYSTTYPVQSTDELGALTGLFNRMIRQLADAKVLSGQQQQQLENSKNFLESVLTHLSSGVMVLDDQFRLRAVNSSAEKILDAQLQEGLGKSLQELALEQILFRPVATLLEEAYETAGAHLWQRQLERIAKNGNQILLMKGMTITLAAETSHVVVIDDITHVLQAERQAAWGEVARRLAHEIKNPLTPIQLSAERLQLKLSEKLDERDAGLLQRATQTIVSQVTAMKNMVADFSDYARSPSPKFGLLDLHSLLSEVLGLYEGGRHPITLRLQAEQTQINGDPTRLRQVIHNLLHNAHDAVHDQSEPQIVLSTLNPESGKVALIVQDNGSGIAEAILGRIFEPYMTTKTKGTGLGLPIVKKIVEEHGGLIKVENRATGGVSVEVRLPLA